jgi:hypothetical protein
LKNVAASTVRILDGQTDHRKSFQWNDITNELEIDDSAYLKMKRLREVEEENNDCHTYNPGR